MRTEPGIVLFTSPTCSWCKVARNYLKENNLKFKTVDISKDKIDAEDMAGRTRQQGVPVILI